MGPSGRWSPSIAGLVAAGLFWVVAAPAAGALEPTGLHHLRFGADQASVLRIFPNASCAPLKQGGSGEDVICSTDTLFGEVPVRASLVLVGTARARQLMSVNLTFESARYGQVKQTMIAQYGEPDAADVASAYWDRPATFIQLLKSGTATFMGVMHSEPGHDGVMIFSTRKFLEIAKERKYPSHADKANSGEAGP